MNLTDTSTNANVAIEEANPIVTDRTSVQWFIRREIRGLKSAIKASLAAASVFSVAVERTIDGASYSLGVSVDGAVTVIERSVIDKCLCFITDSNGLPPAIATVDAALQYISPKYSSLITNAAKPGIARTHSSGVNLIQTTSSDSGMSLSPDSQMKVAGALKAVASVASSILGIPVAPLVSQGVEAMKSEVRIAVGDSPVVFESFNGITLGAIHSKIRSQLKLEPFDAVFALVSVASDGAITYLTNETLSRELVRKTSFFGFISSDIKRWSGFVAFDQLTFSRSGSSQSLVDLDIAREKTKQVEMETREKTKQVELETFVTPLKLANETTDEKIKKLAFEKAKSMI